MSFLRRTPWYVVPLAIFLLTRVLGALLIIVVARDQIPASSLPVDMPLATLVDPHSYLHVIANWDGQWYRLIAEHGYPPALPMQDGAVQQNAWAFYPVFPLLVRLVMFTGASFGFAASVISLGSGAGAMCLLYRMLMAGTGRFTASLTVLALCSAPAAPIFQAAYTESLALLLVLVGLWALERQRYVVLALAGVALSLTRGIVPALVAVVAWEYLRRRRAGEPFPAGERRGLEMSGLIVALSALLWPVVTAVGTGELNAYWKTQTSWTSVAGNNTDSWLVSLPHYPGRLLVVVLALGLVTLVCVRARSWPRVLRMWPVPYLLFILAVTPATASVIRFSMLLGAPWWPAPEWSRRLTSTHCADRAGSGGARGRPHPPVVVAAHVLRHRRILTRAPVTVAAPTWRGDVLDGSVLRQHSGVPVPPAPGRLLDQTPRHLSDRETKHDPHRHPARASDQRGSGSSTRRRCARDTPIGASPTVA